VNQIPILRNLNPDISPPSGRLTHCQLRRKSDFGFEKGIRETPQPTPVRRRGLRLDLVLVGDAFG
jgi:hypothetical protein